MYIYLDRYFGKQKGKKSKSGMGKNGKKRTWKKKSNVERLLLLGTKKMDVETEWRNIGPGKNVVRTP
jgi:hypothetical protein